MKIKSGYYPTIQSANGVKSFRVPDKVTLLQVETMDRALIAYMTAETILERTKDDPEESEEFNRGVAKCLELLKSLENAIITNPDYDLKEYYKVAVDNQ